MWENRRWLSYIVIVELEVLKLLGISEKIILDNSEVTISTLHYHPKRPEVLKCKTYIF
jgi:hypothetical protein